MPLERLIRSPPTTAHNDSNAAVSPPVTKPNESPFAKIINRDFSTSCTSLPTASQALTMTITSLKQDCETPRRLPLTPDRIAAILGRALSLVELSEEVDDEYYGDDDDCDSDHELSPFGTRRDSIDDFRARSLTFQSD